MEHENPSAIAFRRDLPCMEAQGDNLIDFRKRLSEVNKVAKREAKPSFCLICEQESPQFCNSHTVPRYCLKELAVEGKLLTSTAITGGNLLEREVGINEAATFKQICRKCDTEYFKLYETPESLLEAPCARVLGQIAAKNLLREIAKARFQLGAKTAFGDCASDEHDITMSVRSMDVKEDEKAFSTALRVGCSAGRSSAYQLIYHVVLPYTAPFAFQQMISPVADFDGGMVNNVFNPSPSYRIEPIHICVLPVKGTTVVMMFRCKNAKRYRTFERRFFQFEESDKLQAIVKLIFAYSEDVLLSKKIDPSVLKDDRLVQLSRMNHSYFGFGESGEVYRRVALEAALRDFAIDNLPNPPELLSEECSINGS